MELCDLHQNLRDTLISETTFHKSYFRELALHSLNPMCYCTIFTYDSQNDNYESFLPF